MISQGMTSPRIIFNSEYFAFRTLRRSFTMSHLKGFFVKVLKIQYFVMDFTPPIPLKHVFSVCNSWFPLLRFRSALNCGYSGITDKDSGLEWKYWMFSRIFCCWPSRTWPYIAFLNVFARFRTKNKPSWISVIPPHNAKRYENVIRGITNNKHGWLLVLFLFVYTCSISMKSQTAADNCTVLDCLSNNNFS
jgi:hypothetical protein